VSSAGARQHERRRLRSPTAAPSNQADDDSKAEDWPGVGTADIRFHNAIAGLNGSAGIKESHGRARAELRLPFLVMGDPSRLHGPYTNRNHRILKVLEGGDPAKAKARRIPISKSKIAV